MADARDVEAFDRRAGRYEEGWLGEWHRQVVERVVGIVRSLELTPRAVVDVGCGTGRLLRLLAKSLPADATLTGVDPAPAMIARARAQSGTDASLQFELARAESLPFPSGSFDLAVSSVSFDHWSDQRAGLAECARVLRGGGTLVLADLFAAWLAITAPLGRRPRARTPRRVTALLGAAGFEPEAWIPVAGIGPLPLVQAVVAVRRLPPPARAFA